MKRFERKPQAPNKEIKEEVESEEDKRDNLYKKKSVMLEKYQNLLDEFGEEKNGLKTSEKIFIKKEELDDAIAEAENQTKQE